MEVSSMDVELKGCTTTATILLLVMKEVHHLSIFAFLYRSGLKKGPFLYKSSAQINFFVILLY